MTKFPSPVWHELDGGRYIGTGTYSITRDPEEDWLNAGAYRAMVHDKTSVGMLMAAGHHAAIHCEKYFKRGEPMPVVMVLGGDPLCFFYGGLEAPYGVFEIDVVGGLRGKAMKMVKGKVTGLPFPAGAEIVLEGYVTPDKRVVEGPFGEWTGHYAGGAKPCTVLDVKAIYHRNDPILLGVPPMGGGPDEMARYRAVMRSATIKQNIANAGVPGVTQVWCHEIGGARMFHGIAIKQRYPGHAVQAGHIAAQCGASAYASKYIVVVDDDVDVTNLDHLLWAMLTRTDPKESIQFIEGSWDSPADPRLSPEKRAKGDMTHSVAIIDACRPWSWRDKFPPTNTPSAEVARKAKEKFGWLLDGQGEGCTVSVVHRSPNGISVPQSPALRPLINPVADADIEQRQPRGLVKNDLVVRCAGPASCRRRRRRCRRTTSSGAEPAAGNQRVERLARRIVAQHLLRRGQIHARAQHGLLVELARRKRHHQHAGRQPVGFEHDGVAGRRRHHDVGAAHRLAAGRTCNHLDAERGAHVVAEAPARWPDCGCRPGSFLIGRTAQTACAMPRA